MSGWTSPSRRPSRPRWPRWLRWLRAPLPGGTSGETWLSEVDGERTVLRIYGGRSAARGAGAAETDAAVLRWMRGLVPVPEVLEVRRGDPAHDRPGLLITSCLPGVLLEALLPTLDRTALGVVGRHLGVLLGRLAHVALPIAGRFGDPDQRGSGLGVTPRPRDERDLAAYVDARASALGWSDGDLAALDEVVALAEPSLDPLGRVCLVHGDVNAKNLLVDPDTLEVTGLLDWEFAHAGSPYADLGNLLRFDRDPDYVEAVLGAREAMVLDPRPDALDVARAADLFALVELAGRRDENPVARRAADLLLAIARERDLHAVAGG